VGVLDRDYGLVREGLHERRVLVVVRVESGRADLDDAEQAGISEERRGHDRAEAGLAREVVRVLDVGEPVVGEVVAGHDRPAPRDREAVDAAVAWQPLPDTAPCPAELALARRVGKPDEPGLGLDQVELGPIRVDEVTGGLDDLREEVGRVADRGDPGSDLAERLLRSGATADLLARARDRLDEPGVLDRDRRLVGEGLDERDLLRLERPGLGPADLQDAEQTLLAAERGDDERAHAVAPDGLVEARVVLETGVVEVVRADNRLAGGDRLAGGAVRERSPGLVDRGAADDVAGSGDVGEPDPAGRRHDEVDPDPLRTEQARCLVDDVLEEVARVADRGDASGDLAERPLGVGLVAELRPGVVELLDQPGVGHRDRSLAGERLDDPGVVLAERVGLAGVHRQRPERAAVADQRDRDDRPDLVPADVGVGRGRVVEPLVVEVVPGEDRTALADRLAGDPLPGLGLAGPGDGAETGPPAGRGVVRPIEAAGHFVEDVDAGAVGVQQARGLVDRPLQDLLGMTQADDPAADLAQGALGVGTPLDVCLRAAELVDEVGVGHGRGGVVGERAHERDLLVAECFEPARERSHRSECPAAAHERRDEERVNREVADEAVGVGEMDEGGIGRVVVGHDDLAGCHGQPEHPDADVDPERADPRPAAVVGDARVGGEAEDSGRLIEQVGHRAVGPEEAGRLVDGAVEDRGGVRGGGAGIRRRLRGWPRLADAAARGLRRGLRRRLGGGRGPGGLRGRGTGRWPGAGRGPGSRRGLGAGRGLGARRPLGAGRGLGARRPLCAGRGLGAWRRLCAGRGLGAWRRLCEGRGLGAWRQLGAGRGLGRLRGCDACCGPGVSSDGRGSRRCRLRGRFEPACLRGPRAAVRAVGRVPGGRHTVRRAGPGHIGRRAAVGHVGFAGGPGDGRRGAARSGRCHGRRIPPGPRAPGSSGVH
jgi:hypothetical protein